MTNGEGLEYNKEGKREIVGGRKERKKEKEGIKERNEKIIKLIHIKYILKAKDS